MTIPATLAVRQALVARLRANVDVSALVAARIFDHAPEREGFPYVSVRTSNASEWDTSTDFGKIITIETNAYSRKEGRKEAETVLHAIELAMRSWAPAVLTDHRLINIRFEMGDVFREADGKTYFGYARFRAVTEEL